MVERGRYTNNNTPCSPSVKENLQIQRPNFSRRKSICQRKKVKLCSFQIYYLTRSDQSENLGSLFNLHAARLWDDHELRAYPIMKKIPHSLSQQITLHHLSPYLSTYPFIFTSLLSSYDLSSLTPIEHVRRPQNMKCLLELGLSWSWTIQVSQLQQFYSILSVNSQIFFLLTTRHLQVGTAYFLLL